MTEIENLECLSSLGTLLLIHETKRINGDIHHANGEEDQQFFFNDTYHKLVEYNSFLNGDVSLLDFINDDPEKLKFRGWSVFRKEGSITEIENDYDNTKLEFFVNKICPDERVSDYTETYDDLFHCGICPEFTKEFAEKFS